MSYRNLLTRGAIASTALAGALALGLPGIASAADPYPAPTVTATVDGAVITTTVTDTGTSSTASCVTVIAPAAAALPLATSGTPTLAQIAAFQATTGVQAGNVITAPAPTTRKAANNFTVAPGAWAVLAVCADPTGVLSSNYTLAFSPGGVGSLSQGLELGSAVLSMEGGSSLLPGLLTSGIGSSMLGS